MDRTDYQHDKGWIVKDQLADEFFSLPDKLTSYVEAVASDSQAQWICQELPHFSQRDLTHEQVVEIIFDKYHRSRLIIQQCDECDRIHIVENGNSTLHSFNPESKHSHHLLADQSSKEE